MTEKILIVATGNPGKLKEMQAYLEDLEIELQLKPQDLEIEETGKTFVENAALKASQVALAIARPDGSIAVEYQGICQGMITQAPMGTGGFGYDPIFYVPEVNMTFAQMSAELKHKISHRGQAFQGILPQLQTLF